MVKDESRDKKEEGRRIEAGDVPWKKWTRDSLNRRIKICQETVTVPSLKKKRGGTPDDH